MKLFKRRESIRMDGNLPQPLAPPVSLRAAERLSPDVDPHDPLAIGIFYHEKNNLQVAAYYFSVSAARGHPIGLFMYSLCLRHGWAIPQDETEAIRLLILSTDMVLSKQVEFNRNNPLGEYGGSFH